MTMATTMVLQVCGSTFSHRPSGYIVLCVCLVSILLASPRVRPVWASGACGEASESNLTNHMYSQNVAINLMSSSMLIMNINVVS